MSALDTAIGDFGTLLGFDPGDLADREHVAFDIDGLGELHVEKRDETLVIYLARPISVGVDRLQLYRKALRAVHFENRLPARVQCAHHRDNLIFVARHDAHEVTLPTLERTFELLIELHDGVA